MSEQLGVAALRTGFSRYEFPGKVMGDRLCLKLTTEQAIEVALFWLDNAGLEIVPKAGEGK